jgi:phospholipid/cholesterol/gamma-HCH transport system substrate-binding protein
MRRGQKKGLSYFAAGAIALVVTVAIVYFGFTKAVPFQQHYEVKGIFSSSNNLRLNSPVRIAGVPVGKVVKVEPLRKGESGAVVTMRIEDKGRPIKTDATFSIRPRIFLEGNFFVDINPGTPQAPELGDGDTVQASRTRTPVQLDQILTALQADTRRSLQKLLVEYSTGVSGEGGIGFNKSIAYWESAYRSSSIVNEATRGQRPGDLVGYIRNAAVVAEALDRNPAALKSLITDLNTTAAAFAREQGALEQTIAELPRTLRAARPALGALNQAFPPVRRLAREFLPAVRSSGPMIDATLPFVRQARGLVSRAELRGLVADLRPTVASLARLNVNLIPLYQQVRAASSCQLEVILPWSRDTVPDPNFPARGPVYQEQVKFLPGIGGESRSGDANGQWFRVLAANGGNTYNFTGAAGTTVSALAGLPATARIGSTLFPLQGTNPQRLPRPDIRPNVPCETQQKPNLATIPGPPPQQVTMSGAPSPLVQAFQADARAYLVENMRVQQLRQAMSPRSASPQQRSQLQQHERRLLELQRRIAQHLARGAGRAPQPSAQAPVPPKPAQQGQQNATARSEGSRP